MFFSGLAQWVNRVLSWRYLSPLADLTYSTYLIHVGTMFVFYAQISSLLASVEPLAYGVFVQIAFTIVNVLFAYGAGLCVAMIVEFPISNLTSQARTGTCGVYRISKRE